MKRRLIALMLSLTLGLTAAACGTGTMGTSSQTPSTSVSDSRETTTEGSTTPAVTEEETTSETSLGPTGPNVSVPNEDRAGNTVEIPAEVNRIVSLVGSITEILVDLGLGDKLVAIDTNTVGFDGVPTDIPAIDLMSPDIETLLAVDADLFLVSNISDAGGETSAFSQIIDAGIAVAYIPTAESLKDIALDIRFVGEATGRTVEAEALVQTMESGLAELAEVAETIPEEEQRSVFVEISAVPYLYSTGSGTFLNEIIELVGAKNVLTDETAWVPVTEEAAIALNPDVILTNVNYIDDPVGEILGREGWEAVTAVVDEAVYAIDNNHSSLPNHNVLEAAREIAAAVYPDYFK